MIEFDKIKLIIWDMDDTFWEGTLSEGAVTILDRNIELVRKAADCGIVNSICSKNDKDPVLAELRKASLINLFVFPSIDWTPKGQRIAALISDMGLRPANVLFLDDNDVNIGEARYYAQGIMVATPDLLPELYAYLGNRPVTDPEHKRLAQYKVLERKKSVKESFPDNLEFLYSTRTQVDICFDCQPRIDRIHELLLRSNQLNYTKIRPALSNLQAMIDDPGIQTGYVSVRDKFGDYGIVGFFAVRDHECIHFTFSCRAIGQGVEQYVYSTLGYPALNVVEPVVSYVDRSEAPGWINAAPAQSPSPANPGRAQSSKLLFKGPCDLALISSYLEGGNRIETEFTYVSDQGNSIEQHNHSAHILQLNALSSYDKQTILAECLFADEDMFKTRLFDDDLDIIFYSTLPELNLGVYSRKGRDFQVVFGEWNSPLTDPDNWPALINGEAYTGFNKFTYEYLEGFAAKYDFLGHLTTAQSAENIRKIIDRLNPRTILVLILGVEIPFEHNRQKAYENRHLEHKALNDGLRQLAAGDPRIRLLDLNNFVRHQDDFTNNINHFSKRVYYNAAQEAIRIIAESSGIRIKNKSKCRLAAGQAISRLRSGLNPQSKLYKILKRLYRRIRH